VIFSRRRPVCACATRIDAGPSFEASGEDGA
jgi:hypothetical protein